MKKTTGAKGRKAAKKPKAAAGQRDDRPLEVRYREARERVTEPDGHGGTRYRTGYTPEAWAAYKAVLAEWNAPAEREKRDEIAYSEEDAEFVRDAFEGGLNGPAWWHYITLTERERKRAVGLYDESAYYFADGPSAVAGYAKMRGEDWAGELPADVLAAASKREFLARITEGEPCGWAGDGKGPPRVTRRATPSVSAVDAQSYRWERLVEASKLVLVDDRYYPPKAWKKLEAARKRAREEEERKRAEAAKLQSDAATGRAVLAALAGAGVPVAPDAPAPVAPVAPEVTTKPKRGRPKAAHSSPQAQSRAAAYCAMVEYAAKRPELSCAGARRECAEQHGGDKNYQYFVNEENAKKWGQRHGGVQFSKLVEMCRHDAKAWADMKAKLTRRDDCRA